MSDSLITDTTDAFLDELSKGNHLIRHCLLSMLREETLKAIALLEKERKGTPQEGRKICPEKTMALLIGQQPRIEMLMKICAVDLWRTYRTPNSWIHKRGRSGLPVDLKGLTLKHYVERISRRTKFNQNTRFKWRQQSPRILRLPDGHSLFELTTEYAMLDEALEMNSCLTNDDHKGNFRHKALRYFSLRNKAGRSVMTLSVALSKYVTMIEGYKHNINHFAIPNTMYWPLLRQVMRQMGWVNNTQTKLSGLVNSRDQVFNIMALEAGTVIDGSVDFSLLPSQEHAGTIVGHQFAIPDDVRVSGKVDFQGQDIRYIGEAMRAKRLNLREAKLLQAPDTMDVETVLLSDKLVRIPKRWGAMQGVRRFVIGTDYNYKSLAEVDQYLSQKAAGLPKPHVLRR